MQRIAVQFYAHGLLVWTLSACAPDSVPARPSMQTAARESPATQSAATNADSSNTTQPQTAAPTRAPTSNTMTAAMQAPPGTAMGMGKAMSMTMAMAGSTPPKAGQMATPMNPAMPSSMGMGTKPDAGMPSASNAECMQLSTCCSGLMDDRDRSDCERVVERNDAMRCARESTQMCQMPTMPTTMPTMPSESCMKLSSCCDTLAREPLKRDCQQTVMRADADRCTRQLERRCPELLPAPQEPACATLHACCPMLMEPQLDVCRRALSDGNQRACERASMELCK